MAAGVSDAAVKRTSAVRSAWREREVRGLLAAQITSEVGDQFARVAVTLLVLQRAGSTLLAALVLALSYVPSVAGGFLLGTLADRLPRRNLMVACDLLRAVVVVALAPVVLHAPLWVPFVALLVVEFVSVPFDAARSATWPDVVPEPDRLQAAIGVSRTLQQVSLVVGLALGGVLVATVSPGVALYVDAATFVVSAGVLLRTLRHRARPAGGEPERWLRSIRSGARAVVTEPARRALIVLGWLVGAFAITPEAVALTYAGQHGMPGAGGLLLAAVPLGGAVGAAVVSTRSPQVAVRWLLPAVTASCVPLVLTWLDPGVSGALALWVVAGFFQGLVLPTIMVAVNLATPAALRGRVAALAGAGFALLSGLGLAAAGALTDAWSPQAAVGAAGVVGLAVAAAAALLWPRDELAALVAGGPPHVRPAPAQPGGPAVPPG